MIDKYNIDSVVFVPPTVPREVQFMKVLEAELALSLAKINVVKVIDDIRVPQKTLKKLSDRIENAQHTFVVDSRAKFKTTFFQESPAILRLNWVLSSRMQVGLITFTCSQAN